MYSKYRKSVLASSIALALALVSGAALAGSDCDEESHKTNQSHNANNANTNHAKNSKNVNDWNNGRNANNGNHPSNARVNNANMQGQDIASARQESQILTTYSLNSNLRANDLQVSVKKGKATLTGTVEEEVSKELAKSIALGVSGIDSVDNQIMVEADYAPAARTSQDRNFGEVVEDASVTATVKSKLLWSKNTEGMEIDVDTTKGKVTLTGSAKSDAAKTLAGTIAANTRGVLSVDNRLVVDSTTAGTTYMNDDNAIDNVNDLEVAAAVSDGWITTKVNSTFMYSANVQSNDIEVSTDQGIVTLTGTVNTNNERDQAIELAENIRGVKSVNATELKLADGSLGLTGAGLTQNLNNPIPE